MNNYYTIEEKRELLKDVFNNKETQTKFAEYKKQCIKTLGKPREGYETAYGFNACLKMIECATDIDWKKVKWKSKYSSMVSWFSAATSEESLKNSKKLLEEYESKSNI